MGQVLARQRGTLRSVSTLRCGLILTIIAYQSIEVSGASGYLADTTLWFAPTMMLGALTALAGFTITRSIDRNGLIKTVYRTVLRFLPALILIVLLTVCALGSVASTEGFRQFSADDDTAAYLLNLVGLYHADLPGVFEFNPDARTVNAVLRIIPAVYAGLAAIAIAHVRARFTALALMVTIIATAVASVLLAQASDADPDRLDSLASLTSGQTVFIFECMLIGAVGYRMRAKISVGWQIAAAAGVVLCAVLYLSNRNLFNNGALVLIAALLITYLVLFTASLPLSMRHQTPIVGPILWRAMLFSLPVQQCWTLIEPYPSAFLNFVLGLPSIVLLASVEWYLIEQPLLRRLGGEALLPPNTGWMGLKSIPRKREFYARRARTLLVRLAIGLLLMIIMLALFAMTMFAMQRETVGA